jgi:hypothetical protein
MLHFQLNLIPFHLYFNLTFNHLFKFVIADHEYVIHIKNTIMFNLFNLF